MVENQSSQAEEDISQETARPSTNSPAEEQPQEEYPGAWKLAILVLALSLSIFLIALDASIIAIAIPKITDEFHSLDQVGWYGSAYFLTNAAFQATWGKVYKYYALKSPFLLAIFIFELGNLICGAAQNSPMLISGRAIAGMGGAGISAGAFTIIAYISPPKKRPLYIGVFGATYSIASVVAPLLGGFLTDRTTWRWNFWVNLPTGAVACFLIVFFFKTPKAAKAVAAPRYEKIRQLDLHGSALLISAVICYLLALHWGGISVPWNSPAVIGTIVASGLLLAMFVTLEWRSGDAAMIQPRHLKNKIILSSMIYSFFMGGLFFPMLYFLPIQYQSIDNETAAHSGIRLFPLVLTISIITMIANGFISLFGRRVIFIAFLCAPVFTGIATAFMYTLNVDASAASWSGYQALVGFGVGAALQLPVILNQTLVKPDEISIITGMTLASEILGASIILTANESGFVNTLVKTLRSSAPAVDPNIVILSGATRIREVFNPADVPGIVYAYRQGLKFTHASGIACSGIIFVAAIITLMLSLSEKWRRKRNVNIPMVPVA